MENWKERLLKEHDELKERLIKLVDFINSEKYYTLSDGNKTALSNQKIAMEAYLNCLTIRLYGDVDTPGAVPDFKWLTLFGSIFTSSPWQTNSPKYLENNKEEND